MSREAEVYRHPLIPGRRTALGADEAPEQVDRCGDGARADWFPGLDANAVRDAALSAADEAGAQFTQVRVTNSDRGYGSTRDAEVNAAWQQTEAGLAVRVLVDGCWGFAASSSTDPQEAARTSAAAVTMAQRSRPLATRQVVLAGEPAHQGWWANECEIDPFEVPAGERLELLAQRSAELLRADVVSHADAHYQASRERTWNATSDGSSVWQQRIRTELTFVAVTVTADGDVESMQTLAPPTARGWEYALGVQSSQRGHSGWDWEEELAALPDLLGEKLAAPSVEPGRYDLVLDPTHLWLTIHESVGHATELDRAVGYEANYAGSSFATPDLLGSYQYGSPAMTVMADRTARHALATTAWDDEAVSAQRWPLITDGIFESYQRDRAMSAEFGYPRSNGCAYADSASNIPIQRMPNVSLQPDPVGPNLDDLLDQMGEGILILGDNSWSIDMQRFNFQFTGQRYWRISGGRPIGQLRDVGYQWRTPDFWRALAAVGGPSTYMLGGALNCGKGQPGQEAPVSHGSPAVLIRGVPVLNTKAEG